MSEQMGRLSRIIGCIWMMSWAINGLCLGQETLADSLIGVLETAKGADRLPLLMDLVWELKGDSLDRDSIYAQEEIALATQLNDSVFIAQGYNDLGICLYLDGKFQEALEAYETSLTIRKALGRKKDIASSVAKIAMIYQLQGAYRPALEYYQELEVLYDSLGMVDQHMSILMNMSALYEDLGDYETALRLLKKPREHFHRLEQFVELGTIYNNMGNLYGHKQRGDSAFYCYDEAVGYLEKDGVDAPYERGLALMNRGVEWAKLHSLRRALLDLQDAKALFALIGNDFGLADAYLNLGNVYRRMGEYPSAIQMLEKAQDIAEREKIKPSLSIIYEGLALTYESLREHRKAYDWYQRSRLLADSIQGEELKKEILRLQTEFETEKQIQENLRLEQEKKLNQYKMRQQNGLIWALAITLILGGLFAYLLFQRNKLSHQNRLNQLRIEEQKSRLEAVIETQEQERDRIARDLHDGIGQLLAATRMNMAAQQVNQNPEADEQLLDMIDQANREVREIAHTMMPRGLAGGGLVNSLQELLAQSLNQSSLKYHFDAFGEEEGLSHRHRIAVYRICQELIANVLKHAQATEVSIILACKEDQVLLVVEDDGIGVDPNQPVGGMGLSNIQSRIHALNGEFRLENRTEVETGEKFGTIATISIPLADKS